MVRYCCLCTENRAIIKRPKTAEMICKDCVCRVFEDEVHQTIVENKLFHRRQWGEGDDPRCGRKGELPRFCVCGEVVVAAATAMMQS